MACCHLTQAVELDPPKSVLHHHHNFACVPPKSSKSTKKILFSRNFARMVWCTASLIIRQHWCYIGKHILKCSPNLTKPNLNCKSVHLCRTNSRLLPSIWHLRYISEHFEMCSPMWPEFQFIFLNNFQTFQAEPSFLG